MLLGALVGHPDEEVVPDIVRIAEIRRALHPQDRDDDWFDLLGGVGEGGGADEAEDEVDEEARAPEPRRAPGEGVERVVADEALRPVELHHDLIARIDARGAGDAFELEALADVDAGGADLHTAAAVDAVTGRGSRLAARFTAHAVVTDDDRIVVDEHRPEAPVGAHDDAELLAEPREVEIEDAGEGEDEDERPPVLRRRVVHHPVEGGQGDEVGEEEVGDERGKDDVDAVLEHAARDLATGPGSILEAAAGGGISVDPPLDAAEDVVEEDGLGAGPTAPYAAGHGGDDEEGEGEAGDDEKQEPEVLEHQGQAEQVELAV